jgi:transcription elongation factor SPT6
LAYAEQFEDSDPAKGQSPEELLRKARMLLSTELGKDPLLRSQMRKLFKEEARVTVEPTERGITKIDENHPYFVSYFCVFRPGSKLIISRTSNISIRSRSTIC